VIHDDAYHIGPTHLIQGGCVLVLQEWGGGLEIVALSNALERPICLYELKPVGMLFWSRSVDQTHDGWLSSGISWCQVWPIKTCIY
jgi:hypothetical protein